jgi:large subunit ribosomal protein L10
MVKEVSEQIRKYPVIGIIDMHSLPASQLHHIRTLLRGKAVIRMVKKRIIVLALKESGLRGTDVLSETLQGEPALIMSEMDPFRLARMVEENKSEAPARGGDIAPRDIVITAGPTPLPPGPVIGELQKAKIPASIEGDKIHVRQDTVVAREGEEIGVVLAGVLAKLGITPMEIGLNLVAAWEDGTVYGKDILFIPRDKYISDLVAAHQRAFNLAYGTGYPTAYTMPLLLSKAHNEAYSLAMQAGILTSETVGPLVSRAHAQAEALVAKAGIGDEPIPPGEGPEKGQSGEAPKEEPDKKEEKPPEGQG